MIRLVSVATRIMSCRESVASDLLLLDREASMGHLEKKTALNALKENPEPRRSGNGTVSGGTRRYDVNES